METIAINQSNNGRGDPSAAKTPDISPPDCEVTGKRLRRKFTAKYKLRMLKKAEACTSSGQLGSLLRQEGLYSSNLTTWRKQRDDGLLIAMVPKNRGRKAQPKNPLGLEVARLQKENHSRDKEIRP
ncbi:MAG: hypothetical protein J7M30_08410 [Deltaproteobacteria bacterium]|nr:hypothetical protein [Deltaproteobacteria bacterium]